MSIIPSPGTPSGAPNVATTIHLSAAYTVASGATLYMSDAHPTTLFYAEFDTASVVNNGSVWAISSDGDAYVLTSNNCGLIDNRGLWVAETAAGDAVGVLVGSEGPGVTNSGSIYALATGGTGIGIEVWDPGAAINNGGLVAASSSNGFAVGINMANGGSLTNASGASILAEGVYARAILASGEGSITNSGTIQAQSLSKEQASVAVWLEPYDGPRGFTVTNSGVIKGDYAFYSNAFAYSPAAKGQDHIINEAGGKIYGVTYLSLGDDSVENHGSIQGNVYLAEGNDTFDNTGGTLVGYADMGWGDDTYTGGTGADDVRGDRGNDTMDGGAGQDLLLGGYGDDSLTGGAGNDGLFGEFGNDTIVTKGADYVDGGGGNDRIEVKDLTFERIDGGDGVDTLVLSSGAKTLDLRLALGSDRLHDIEALELKGQQDIVIRSGNITQLTGGETQLTVNATDTDKLDLVGSWTEGSAQTIDGVDYRTFSLGTESVLIHGGTVSIDAAAPAGATGLDPIASGSLAPWPADWAVSGPYTQMDDYWLTDSVVIGPEEIWYTYTFPMLEIWENVSVTNYGEMDALYDGVAGPAQVIFAGHLQELTNYGSINAVNHGQARAIYIEQSGLIHNEGIIRAIGDGIAVAIETYESGYSNTPGTYNSGTILAQSDYGSATALIAANNGYIVNDGLITATGATGATGIVGYEGGAHVTNTGQIIADVTGSNWPSVGIQLSYLVLASDLTNSGDINADTAISMSGSAPITVTNTGTIEGNVYLGAADDVFDGSGGKQWGKVFGGRGNDSLKGWAGADWLDGGAGADTLNGGAGNDVYGIDNVADVIIDTSGIDRVETSIDYTLPDNMENLTLVGDAVEGTGNALNNIITGSIGDNNLYGLGGDDNIKGDAGNDTLIGGDGNDILDGGVGVDLAGYASATSGVTVNLSISTSQNTGAAGLDTLKNIEGVVGSDYADHLTGSSGDNQLFGALGDDSLTGGLGNDLLDGGAGADAMAGGAGDDTYIVDDAHDVITENPGEGIDLVSTGGSYTLGAGLENLTLTGTAAANGTGNAADNTLQGNTAANVLSGLGGADKLYGDLGDDGLYGGADADTLDGGGGNDTLDGGDGNDTLIGGAGNDSLVGGAGIDTVTYAAATTSVTINLATGVGSGDGSDTFSGVENIIGGKYNDKLTGDSGNNVLDGGGGSDILTGGAGDDTYIVYNGPNSSVVEKAGEGIDLVETLSDFNMPANVENMTMLGNARTGNGNDLNNIIIGNDSQNYIDGGAGDDHLYGGGGDDQISGGAGFDVIDGGDGMDVAGVATSGSVTVTLNGSATVTVYVDGVATDTICNVEGISSGSGADVLIGDAGVNYFYSGDGDDWLKGGGGADLLFGYGGSDTADFSDKTQSVVATATGYETTTVLVGGVEEDWLNQIENLVGGTAADTLTGDGQVNHLSGGGGNDTLAGAGGDDVLDGGAGADTMTGGAGSDTYIVDSSSDVVVEQVGEGVDLVQSSVSYALSTGVENLTLTGGAAIDGAGNDASNTLHGNDAANVLKGLGGDDVIDGGGGIDTASYAGATAAVTVDLSVGTAAGGAGSDTLSNIENATGSSYADHLIGNAGTNVLDGGAGGDTLEGGLGDDTYVVDSAADVVTEAAGAGVDSVQASVTYTLGANIENLTLVGAAQAGTGNELANLITGNAGNNTLSGLGGDDQISGGVGNDTLKGGAGADLLDGGTGSDTADYGDKSDSVVITLTGGDVVAKVGGVAEDTLRGIENLTGGLGADTLTGDGNGNQLSGGAGNDWLRGRGGADVLDGGSGLDTADYTEKTAAIVVTLAGSTNATVFVGGAVEDTVRNIENIVGGAAGDTLTGSTAANQLFGKGGDDVLSGGAGNDWLDGGTGADAMSGGTGNDVFVVDNLLDSATENSGEGTDRVESTVSWTLGANLENLTLKGAAAIDGTGNDLANTIIGNSGDNILSGAGGVDHLQGASGNDTLDGGAGDDVMTGGKGNDTYYVDSAHDAIGELAGEGVDTVNSTVSLALGANLENLTLSGSDPLNGTGNTLNNILTGNAGANVLSGNAGSDHLYGGGGDDVLHGGDATDYLQGGSGLDLLYGEGAADRFIFDESDMAGVTSTTCDRIVDFSHGQHDLIDLSAIDAIAATAGADDPFAFVGTAAFSGTAGELRYEIIGGNTLVTGDVNGDGVADFMIRLDGSHPLVAADFIL